MKNAEEGRLLIVTVGFETDLPLRALMRVGISPFDRILLISPNTGGEYEKRKARRAVDEIKKIVSMLKVPVSEVPVSCANFSSDVLVLIREIKKAGKKEVVAILAGGMRMLIPEVVSATTALRKYWGKELSITYFFMREDGMHEARLGQEFFTFPNITNRESRIIKLLAKIGGRARRSDFVKKLSESLGVTESMAYKFITALISKKALELRESDVELTEIGRIVAEALPEETSKKQSKNTET